MKRVFLISISCLLYLSVSEVNAQIDTSRCLSYFPFHAGDKWQYEISDFGPSRFDTTFYRIFEVLCDTVMPNQKRYFRLSTRYRGQYLRIDTSELKVKCYNPVLAPDSELVYFDLHPTGNYSGNSGYTVYVDSGFGQVGLLPCSEKYYSYFWNDGFTRNFKLSQNYGISYWDLRELMGFQGVLIAAEIDGIQYGQFMGLQKKHSLPSNKLVFFNYPNPFNFSTTIEFIIPAAGSTSISIFDLRGKIIHKFTKYYTTPGKNRYNCDKVIWGPAYISYSSDITGKYHTKNAYF